MRTGRVLLCVCLLIALLGLPVSAIAQDPGTINSARRRGTDLVTLNQNAIINSLVLGSTTRNSTLPNLPGQHPSTVNSGWKGGTGNWSVASDWTPGGVPNNGGGNTYNVTIDGLGGTGQRQYDVHAILRRIGSQTYCQLLHPEILFYKANAAQPLLLGLPPFYESYIYRPSPYLGVASTGSLGTPPCAAWEIQKALTF
jgi:hypothetical protein